MKLTQAIQKAKEARGLNDAQLSRLLGQNKSLWSMVQNGKREPSKWFLSALIKHLPEVGFAVTDYLRGE